MDSCDQQEEALASVDNSVAEVDQWEQAHFREGFGRALSFDPRARKFIALLMRHFGRRGRPFLFGRAGARGFVVRLSKSMGVGSKTSTSISCFESYHLARSDGGGAPAGFFAVQLNLWPDARH
jgi:hypothetical protein